MHLDQSSTSSQGNQQRSSSQPDRSTPHASPPHQRSTNDDATDDAGAALSQLDRLDPFCDPILFRWKNHKSSKFDEQSRTDLGNVLASLISTDEDDDTPVSTGDQHSNDNDEQPPLNEDNGSSESSARSTSTHGDAVASDRASLVPGPNRTNESKRDQLGGSTDHNQEASLLGKSSLEAMVFGEDVGCQAFSFDDLENDIVKNRGIFSQSASAAAAAPADREDDMEAVEITVSQRFNGIQMPRRRENIFQAKIYFKRHEKIFWCFVPSA